MSNRHALIVFCSACLMLLPAVSALAQSEMLSIPAGSYQPLFKSSGSKIRVDVEAFEIDRLLVSNEQFKRFVLRQSRWHRDNIKPIFADANYLAQFRSAASFASIAQQPVTHVSWFAARAYCKAQGKRLPGLDEWEHVAAASATQADGRDDVEHRRQILDWYAKPARSELPDAQNTPANYWQVQGLHGVVWELVDDFNSALVSGESRGDTALEKQLFCGAGAASSADPADYAAFMRYALRSSYEASYTLESMGFRCARDIQLMEEPAIE
ncbi:MAG: sulfatase modifying factor 1 [Planctomycetota bacterium]|jgi:sulfatase modifying factor 1